MSKFAAFFFVVLLAVAAGAAGFFFIEQDKAQVLLAETQIKATQAADQVSLAKAERDKLKAQVASLEQRLAEAEKSATQAKQEATTAREALAQAAAQPSATASRSSVPRGGPTGAAGSPMKGLAEMMKNPAMREMAKQQQIAMMDSQYGGLFSQLNLSPEERDNLKQLLAERLSSQMDLGMKLMDDSLTPPQRQAMMKEVGDAVKANDEKIRTFMNDEGDFNSFKHWEDTKGERQMLTMGKGAFSAAGEPLTPEQESQLVDAMSAAGKQITSIPDFNKPGAVDPGTLTNNDVQRQLQRFDEKAKATRQAAAAFLTPGQLKALDDFHRQQRAMTEAGLNMTRNMFSSQKR